MATTSILASRPWKDEDDSQPNVEVANAPDKPPRSPKRGSEALLMFLEIAGKACVGVAPDLEPVHHLETLGEGLSFSVKVHRRKQSGSYVLKVFKYSLVAGQNDAFDQDRFRALMMEAHVLGSRPLHDHENIVTMTEIALAVRSSNPLQISPALVLERAPYGTLESFQHSVSKSQVIWAIRKMLSYDVAAGVKVLHECGVVHGDLKAENVLVFDHPVRGYVAKLGDFGSAVILPIDVSASYRARLSAYTPPWNAPEATSYLAPDQLPRTDVYSLGILIWRILVHRDPFLLFDLPLDPDTRLGQKSRILAASNIAGLIPYFIEQEVGFLDADEILLLAQIFANTINVDPGVRSLDRLIKLLLLHSGRMITATSESMRLTPFIDNLTNVLIQVLRLSPKSEANSELSSASS
jgi:serine/threonine protein kinase